MGIQINQYTLEKFEVGDEDYLDMDFWNGASYESAKIKGMYVKSSFPRGIFTQTTGSPNVTGTTESTLLTTGSGSLTVGADAFKVGDTFQLTMYGTIGAANNEHLEIKLKAGSIILATTGSLTLPQITGLAWHMSVNFCVRSLGASGVGILITTGEFAYMKDSNLRHEAVLFASLNNSTFDTTISNTLDVTATWGSANGANKINSQLVLLEKQF